MDYDKIKTILGDIIDCHTHLRKTENGFEGDIYLDYRDELSDSQLKEICQSDNKMDAFYDILAEYVMDCDTYEVDALLSEIRAHWDSDTYGDMDDHWEAIRDYISDYVQFNFDYDHFLNQDVRVNIIVDSGDANYDFVLNNFTDYYNRDNSIDDNSSILWLAQQQGYTKGELWEAVFEGKYDGSKFLKSVHQECMNISSHMNALAFFVSMTLKGFIEWADSNNDITLSRDTSCGLYDCWNGSGSMLEIELERDVVIPRSMARPHMDGTRGYGVDDIYGMLGSFWKDTVIKWGA